jgi:hypothetical protein
MVDYRRRKPDQKTYDLVEALNRVPGTQAIGEMNNTSVVELHAPATATGPASYVQSVGGKKAVTLLDNAGYTWSISNGVIDVTLSPGETARFLVIDA